MIASIRTFFIPLVIIALFEAGGDSRLLAKDEAAPATETPQQAENEAEGEGEEKSGSESEPPEPVDATQEKSINSTIDGFTATPPEFATISADAAIPEGRALHTAWVKAKYRFTPEVRAAFIAFEKAAALADLKAAGQELPAEFLAWVDSDPVVQGTVYGIKSRPANVLRILRSLELDLGKDAVRNQYTQLALAMAVSNAEHKDYNALGISLAERPVMKLVIPPNPLKPVNTNDPNRTLDQNDHIINFLNSRPFEFKVKVAAAKKGDPATTETRTRPMVGADVIANKPLQEEFNAYMQSKGCAARVDCLPPWPGRPGMGQTISAFIMFRNAYMAKGLLPERDRAPTLAETCAFLIRNYEYKFPAEINRSWPPFPMKEAPWPTMTFLALGRDPLRECEEIWQNFRDTGRPNKRGVEYLGKIAHTPILVQARSVAPLDYGYGSVQMWLKDGGVCGTQSGVIVRSRLALGNPSSTTIEIGHCGTTGVRYDTKLNGYVYNGGDMHLPWPFSNPTRTPGLSIHHRPMISGINLGMPRFLDSSMATRVSTLLDPAAFKEHGLELLKNALEINPFNVLASGGLQTFDPHIQFRLMSWVQGLQEAARSVVPACQPYMGHYQLMLMNSLNKMPVPADKEACREIYAYLSGAHPKNKLILPLTLARYQAASEGLPAVLNTAEKALKDNLASERNKVACDATAQTLRAAAEQIPDKTERVTWAKARIADMAGKESFLNGPKRVLLPDPCLTFLSALAGLKMPAAQELNESVLNDLAARFQTDLAGLKNAKDPKEIAARKRLHADILIYLPQIIDAPRRRTFRDDLVRRIGDSAQHQILKQALIKSEWKVAGFSRQSKSPNAFATLAIDGNPVTAWHTSDGATAQNGLPQDISVDMGEIKTIRGFVYTPRGTHPGGRVDDYALHTSIDGKDWVLVAEKTFDPKPIKTAIEQTVAFKPVQARYFKFTARHVVKDDYALAAELGVIE